MAEIATTPRQTRMNETEVVPYKPLFGPAVVSFVLGLLSVLGLAPWPPFLAIPLGAVITGVWALLTLRRMSGADTGRRTVAILVLSAMASIVVGGLVLLDVLARPAPLVLLALLGVLVLVSVASLARVPNIMSDALSGDRMLRIGVTLGFVCGAGGLVNFQIPREILIQGAVETGQRWLEALAKGQMEEAIILTLHPVQRPPENITLERLLGSKDTRNAYNQLRQLPLFKTLNKLGPDAEIRLDSVEEFLPKAATEVQLVYQVKVPPEEGSAKARYFLVMLQMVTDRSRLTGKHEWRVYEPVAPYYRGTRQLPKARPEQIHDHDLPGGGH